MKKITIILIAIIAVFGIVVNAKSYSSDADKMQRDLHEVYKKYKNFHEGSNASYIPILEKIDPSLFGIAIVTVDGKLFLVGDAEKLFAIESISKPFVYALALQDNGGQLNALVGLNATGDKFNSVMALEQKAEHVQNPFVNAGAIQVTDYIKGKNNAEKWQKVLNFISALTNEKINLGAEYYRSESLTNQHNLGIAYLLASYGLIKGDPAGALDRYTKACSVVMSARQLALMGSVLANGGINPLTHERLIASGDVKNVLSQMIINGMYENSGTWLTEVGIPSKSGVGGGILAIVPNRMAIVVYSPPLDAAGNSVKGQLVIKELSNRWNLHLLANQCEI